MTQQEETDIKKKALPYLIENLTRSLLESLKKEKESFELLQNDNELNEINSFLQQQIDALEEEWCNKIDNIIVPKLKIDYGIDFSSIDEASKNIKERIKNAVELNR